MVFMMLFIALSMSSVLCAQQADTVHIKAQQHAKMNLLVAIIGDASDAQCNELATTLKKDIEWSGQFNCDLQYVSKMASKKQLRTYARTYPIGIFVSDVTTPALEWRMYDLHTQTMLKGQKYTKRGSSVRGWAHTVADAFWPLLTGQQSIFSTKIAYCKQAEQKGKRALKHIYIADYDGSHAQLLVDTPTVNVAPRWNMDLNMPLLFYSEYTSSNVCLMSSTMNKQRKIAANFDGITMIPSFSQDGKKVVFCASRGDGSCQLYCYEGRKLKKLTHNKGNNLSPSLTADGKRIYFCSDYQTGNPQIYCYNFATNTMERISQGGYCTSPHYSQRHGRIVYVKITSGISQLFVYDEQKKTHTQLTFDATNKDECCWSACGNYILFAAEQKGKNRIVVFNLLTNEKRFITSPQDSVNYPAWSPAYTVFPEVA